MRETDFFASSKNIVKDFLSSVIAIDDNLVFDATNKSHNEADDDFDDSVENDSGLAGGGYVDGTNGVAQNYSLNYQDLSLAFAEYGVNCSAFRPEKARFSEIEMVAEQIKKSAKRADITILDWSMDAEYGGLPGELAKLSISKILDDDEKQHGRLRLIVIYTAEPDLEAIANDIHSYVSRKGATQNQIGRTVVFTRKELEFCRIAVIAKKEKAEDLRDEVINLFTELTIGLLSNATLSSISELRDKTHHILHTFNSHLDPAYLSHVLGLLSSPDMREQAHEVAFDYAVDLLSENLKAELQISNRVKDSLCKSVLGLWPAHISQANGNDCFGLKVGGLEEVKFGSDRMQKLLTFSSENELQATLAEVPQIAHGQAKGAIDVFKRENIELTLKNSKTDHHLELSAIQCVRRDLKNNGANIPVLKQGSVIKDKNNKYYLCVQPLCDSVRLKQNANFTFIKINKVTGGKTAFTHVIRQENGTHVRLCVKPSSKEINVFSFVPCEETKVVKATRDEHGKLLFTGASEGASFEWCGEFKKSISQEIVNSVSASISRVGFDSFEWLRLKSSG